MRDFLRTYWAFLVIPVLVAVAIVVLLALTGDDPASPIYYNH